MQRATNSGSRGDQHDVEIPLQQQAEQHMSPPTKTKKMMQTSAPTPLPLFLNSLQTPAAGHPSFAFSSPDKWVHLIPLLVLLTFFFLWFFSNPVNLVIKDGRTTLVHPTDKPIFINETDTVYDLGRLTILAISTSPHPSVELTLTMADKKGDNDTHPVSGNDN